MSTSATAVVLILFCIALVVSAVLTVNDAKNPTDNHSDDDNNEKKGGDHAKTNN